MSTIRSSHVSKPKKAGHLNVELDDTHVEYLDDQAARQHHSSRRAIVLQLISYARKTNLIVTPDLAAVGSQS